MANLNKILLIGNLTRDPEVRYTPKGTAVGELGLAVNRRAPDGNGGYNDETTFIDVTLWGNNAENAQKYLAKGRSVFIEGRLQLDSWEDKQSGQKRTKLKVVAEVLQFLGGGEKGEVSKAKSDTPPRNSRGGFDRDGRGNPVDPDSPAGGDDDYPDDIPF